MMKININNIEELIFKNTELKKVLPEFRHIFDQWYLSYRSPAFHNMRKISVIELLNAIEAKIVTLQKFFKDTVTIERLDVHTVKNIKLSINDSIEEELTKYRDYTNITISRNADTVYICLWR